MLVATFSSGYTWSTNPNEAVNEQQETEISKKQPRFMLQNMKIILGKELNLPALEHLTKAIKAMTI